MLGAGLASLGCGAAAAGGARGGRGSASQSCEGCRLKGGVLNKPSGAGCCVHPRRRTGRGAAPVCCVCTCVFLTTCATQVGTPSVFSQMETIVPPGSGGGTEFLPGKGLAAGEAQNGTWPNASITVTLASVVSICTVWELWCHQVRPCGIGEVLGQEQLRPSGQAPDPSFLALWCSGLGHLQTLVFCLCWSPGSRPNGPAALEPRWVFISCSPGEPLKCRPADPRSGCVRDCTPALLGVQSRTKKLLTLQNASCHVPSALSCCLVSSLTSPRVGEAAP